MDKILRCTLGTWRKLRGAFPAKKNESVEKYLARLVDYINSMEMEEASADLALKYGY